MSIGIITTRKRIKNPQLAIHKALNTQAALFNLFDDFNIPSDNQNDSYVARRVALAENKNFTMYSADRNLGRLAPVFRDRDVVRDSTWVIFLTIGHDPLMQTTIDFAHERGRLLKIVDLGLYTKEITDD